jgi:hypothetical protein
MKAKRELKKEKKGRIYIYVGKWRKFEKKFPQQPKAIRGKLWVRYAFDIEISMYIFFIVKSFAVLSLHFSSCFPLFPQKNIKSMSIVKEEKKNLLVKNKREKMDQNNKTIFFTQKTKKEIFKGKLGSVFSFLLVLSHEKKNLNFNRWESDFSLPYQLFNHEMSPLFCRVRSHFSVPYDHWQGRMFSFLLFFYIFSIPKNKTNEFSNSRNNFLT